MIDAQFTRMKPARIIFGSMLLLAIAVQAGLWLWPPSWYNLPWPGNSSIAEILYTCTLLPLVIANAWLWTIPADDLRRWWQS
jgi:hypothetical protein